MFMLRVFRCVGTTRQPLRSAVLLVSVAVSLSPRSGPPQETALTHVAMLVLVLRNCVASFSLVCDFVYVALLFVFPQLL